MAEIVAIGAAATQLVHYSVVLISSISALSRSIRHAPDQIQTWLDQSSTTLSILDDVRAGIVHSEQSILYLIDQCRNDILAVRSLLQPVSAQGAVRRRSFRFQEAVFVVRWESQIERRMESFRRTFNTMALSLLVLSVNRNEARSQQAMYFQPPATSFEYIHNPDDLVDIAARSNMGIALFLEGRLNEAEDFHRYAYDKRRLILGPHHEETTKSKANIAMILNEQGYHNRAETLYREALITFDSTLGFAHPETLKTCHNLATVYHDQGKYEQAEEAIDVALPSIEATYGEEHEEFLGALEFRAILLHCLKMYAAALEIVEQVFEQRLISSGYYHEDTQRVLGHMTDLRENYEKERGRGLFLTSLTETPDETFHTVHFLGK